MWISLIKYQIAIFNSGIWTPKFAHVHANPFVQCILGEIFCEHSSLQQHPRGLSVTKKCFGGKGALAHTEVEPLGVPQRIPFKNTTLVSPLTGKVRFKENLGDSLHIQKVHSMTIQNAHEKSFRLDTPVKQKYKYQKNWILDRFWKYFLF